MSFNPQIDPIKPIVDEMNRALHLDLITEKQLRDSLINPIKVVPVGITGKITITSQQVGNSINVYMWGNMGSYVSQLMTYSINELKCTRTGCASLNECVAEERSILGRMKGQHLDMLDI